MRRRLPETSGLFPACLFVAATLFASPLRVSAQEGAPSEPSSVDALEQFVATIHSLSARFTQELWSADQRLLETESGLFLLSRPNRFVWHSETPLDYRVVSDGETLWMYDVELEQVTRTPLADISEASPAMLLSGQGDVTDSFDVEQSYTIDGRDWIKLIPKDPGGDFSSILVAFGDGLPREIELVDGLDQTTRIAFTEIEVDPDLDPGEFEFTPPPGVSVIGGD